MTNARLTLGQRAENLIAARLCRAGYTLLDRNWRHADLGELDIVARRGDVLVFVEVRARRGPIEAAVEQALASVNARKQARLARLAEAYLVLHDLDDLSWRIDVAAVGTERGRLAVEIVTNAVDW
ncbi:MAG: YraN family protein [Chloroflexi bacterium]|nr:YraN family protein [Chloroflexota bacterium]